MITKTLLASVNKRLQAKDRKEWNIRARAPTPCPWCLVNCPHPHFYNFYSTSCPNHSPPQSYLPVFHFCSMFTSMNVLLRIIVNSCCCCCCCVASVVSDSVRPHRRQPNRLLRPWDSPGKNTGVGCHFLPNAWKWKVKVKSLSRARLLATPWTTAYQAPPSMGFSRQEYWSGLPLPSPRH